MPLTFILTSMVTITPNHPRWDRKAQRRLLVGARLYFPGQFGTCIGLSIRATSGQMLEDPDGPTPYLVSAPAHPLSPDEMTQLADRLKQFWNFSDAI